MYTPKKTILASTGAAAAAVLIVGAFGAPAMADTTSSHDSTSSWTQTTTDLTSTIEGIVGDISNSSPVVVAPSVGDIGVGDIGSGNAVASGNDVTAPIASGNETAVGSGNDTAVGNNSGNGNSVGGDTSIGSEVGDLVDNVTDLDVDGMVDNILDDVDLNSILGR